MKLEASRSVPWVIVAGGFHRGGAMDRANAAVAEHLLRRGTRVHLVAHRVDGRLAALGATVHPVPRPLGSFALGGRALARHGRAVAATVTSLTPGARVLVNGGNCDWPDGNWVHCVHRAWRPVDDGAPAWFRLKNRIVKVRDRWHERRAIRSATIVIANSDRTSRDLTSLLDVQSGRIHTVYLGADAEAGPPTPLEHATARAWLGAPDDRPLVAFVGTLGYDLNKGFDTLWAAWQRLTTTGGWDAFLVVAGGGHRLDHWRREVARAGLAGSIRFLGFTDRVRDVLAGADLLVSPVRYEAYGLNVHEAICRGVPALVSKGAGVAERYPPELEGMLLPDPEAVDDLAKRLVRWRLAAAAWKERFVPLSRTLRTWTWADMAARIVALLEERAGAASAGLQRSRGQPLVRPVSAIATDAGVESQAQ